MSDYLYEGDVVTVGWLNRNIRDQVNTFQQRGATRMRNTAAVATSNGAWGTMDLNPSGVALNLYPAGVQRFIKNVGYFDWANNRFVTVVEGLWQFGAFMSVTATTDNMGLWASLCSGDALTPSTPRYHLLCDQWKLQNGASGGQSLTMETSVYLNAGDVLFVQTWGIDQTAARSLQAATNYSAGMWVKYLGDEEV